MLISDLTAPKLTSEDAAVIAELLQSPGYAAVQKLWTYLEKLLMAKVLTADAASVGRAQGTYDGFTLAQRAMESAALQIGAAAPDKIQSLQDKFFGRRNGHASVTGYDL